ncbi:hypothetical protein [Labilibaculum sp.]|uniref:hypothetical protein n=1 Tax=Labilibaculum sp. TaxID=2060723 RepID=UPI003561FC9A
MKEARIYVDFNDMLEDNLVPLSENDLIEDSKGNNIELKAGIHIKIYADDFSSCHKRDNLIAEGIVEEDSGCGPMKWNCRIDKKGIYNESQG